ncbi:MAG: S9 family peptidase [Elusimicrobiales bacterium]|nr:S9 family peptidase [Elusimicrobiales bacterium]
MRNLIKAVILTGVFFMTITTQAVQAIEPPVAEKILHKIKHLGHERIDNYFWLKERKNPKVTKYLKAENAYAASVMKHTDKFQEKLFTEMKSRIKKDDSSVPVKDGEYYYYSRYTKGKEYPIYARKHKTLKAAEEIILDVNKIAKGHAFCNVRFPKVSFDHKKIAFVVDTKGRRFYTIYFKDLTTGKILEEKISNTAGNLAWANDNKTIFYVKQNPKTLRWEKVLKHVLGSKKDKEIFFEKDDTFDIGLGKSKTDKYIFMSIAATLSSEYRILDANNPDGEFKLFYKRRPKLEYDIDDGGDVFYITHNDKAKNFKVSTCPKDKTDKTHWTDIVEHRKDVLVEYIDVYKKHLIVKEIKNGLGALRIIERDGKKEHNIKFNDPAYIVDIGGNPDYASKVLRFTYESLTTPDSVYDYNMRTRKKKLKKQQEVLGDFKPENYVSKRLWFKSRDGVKVPMSIVYRKGMIKNGKNPLHIYSYGSYGSSSEPYFSTVRLTLLDRGFICAIAHIRGGSEMGRHWYDDGKLLKKKNTFYDFIDATKFLVSEGYSSPEHIYAEGGSAGGLLMGAISNMAPKLYNGILAGVPFVDVITTMLDTDIPLTTSEYDEWGNPNEKKYYDYMLSYSPYDNVKAQKYPNMLITAGLHDSQVQYWEPAKWAAKLRDMKTNDNLVILKTDMEVGHGGKTGRFEGLKLVAFEYAFMFNLEGIKK